jgi:hypothetical protein
MMQVGYIANRRDELTCAPGIPRSPQAALMSFTRLERLVIMIGFSPGEPPFMLFDRPPRRKDRLCQLFFGLRPATPLADGRLEGLRAMAAAVRDCANDPDAEMMAVFVAAGWSSAHVGAIQDLASARWGERNLSKRRSLATWICRRRARRCISGSKYPAAMLGSCTVPIASDHLAVPAGGGITGLLAVMQETVIETLFSRRRSNVRAN